MLHRLTILLLLVTTHLNAQNDLTNIKTLTKTLCSAEFHGRGYVMGGDSIAADFIAEEFQRAGLQPLNGSYFQPFSFAVNTFPDKTYFQQKQTHLVPGRDVLADPASPKFYGKLIYRHITAREILNEELLMDALQPVLSNSRYNAVLLDFTEDHPDTVKIVKDFKYELAQFVPVIQLTDKKFTWSVAHEQLANPIFEIQKSAFDKQQPLNVLVDAVLEPKHVARNVIGYMPAAKQTDKTIVFTAHYDHLGQFGADAYFPGANDNASGTAFLMSLTSYFKENPSKYNILFIAFAGEEAGLIGSHFYTENPLLPLENIEFLINLDIMGSGEEGITIVNGSVFPKAFKTMLKINKKEQLLVQIKARGEAANSDHYFFTVKGVPSFFIYTMGPNKNYHDIDDTYENLSFAETADITKLLAAFVERIPKKKK